MLVMQLKRRADLSSVLKITNRVFVCTMRVPLFCVLGVEGVKKEGQVDKFWHDHCPSQNANPRTSSAMAPHTAR